jgi:hypothetical protein
LRPHLAVHLQTILLLETDDGAAGVLAKSPSGLIKFGSVSVEGLLNDANILAFRANTKNSDRHVAPPLGRL